MKRSIKFLLFSALAFTFFISCKKNDMPSNGYSNVKKQSDIQVKKKDLIEWIGRHEAGADSNIVNHIKILRENLDYANLRVEKRKNGDDIIIIPITGDINSKLNIHKNYLVDLIVVKNAAGKFRWSTVVCFLAENEKAQTLKDNTIKNIFNNIPPEDNGTFKFFSIQGSLLFQVQYKDGKLYSYAHPTTAKALNSAKKTQTSQITSSSNCTEWFLITIYYYANGSTEITADYLYTTCSNQDTQGDGGGGGGDTGDSPGEPQPEEPNDMELSTTSVFNTYDTQMGNDDLVSPPVGNPIEYDADGNPQAPVANYTQVQYEYRVSITYKAVTRVILGISMSPVIAYPNSETYTNPSWGSVIRVVTPITTSTIYSGLGTTVAHCSWGCLVTFRYTYLSSGGTRTLSRSADYSADVTVP